MTTADQAIQFHGRAAPELPDPGGRLPVALVFPGEAGLALSTLGWQSAWRILAREPGVRVERVFAPKRGQEPVSLDSGLPLRDFPLICISVNFEEELKTVIEMLDAAGIPPRRASRPGWPLVLVGGPVAFLNPAPLAPLADAFFVGEAEDGLADTASAVRGAYFAGADKAAALFSIASMPGIYAPGLSEVPVRRRIAGGIGPILHDPAYSSFISSEAAFRDMFLVEVNRGCPYGCRFCAAGSIYRPPRRATLSRLKELVEAANPRKVGLVGTALTDWPDLREFLLWLRERKTAFSLSSVRADGLDDDFLQFLRDTGARSLTLALEAPSERLRRAAGKRLDSEALLRVVETVSRLRFNKLKLYLIVGWPGEEDADYEELADFMARVQEARERGRGRKGSGLELLMISVSPLVPKPFTPLQWAAMASEEDLSRRIEQVRAACRPFKGVRVEGESPFAARLQGLLARGDEEMFDLAELAAKHGSWRAALKEWGVDTARYLLEKSQGELFPWEVIDPGVSRAHLWKEWQGYLDCRAGGICPAEGCGPCGRCDLSPKQGKRSGRNA